MILNIILPFSPEIKDQFFEVLAKRTSKKG